MNFDSNNEVNNFHNEQILSGSQPVKPKKNKLLPVLIVLAFLIAVAFMAFLQYGTKTVKFGDCSIKVPFLMKYDKDHTVYSFDDNGNSNDYGCYYKDNFYFMYQIWNDSDYNLSDLTEESFAYQCYNSIDENDRMLIKGNKFYYKYKEQGKNYYCEEVCLKRNGKLYSICYSATYNNFRTFMKRIDKWIDSAEFD